MTRSWLFVVLATLSCGGVVGADIAEEKGGHDAGRTPVADAGTVVAQPEPDAGVESPTLDAGETPAPGADAGRPPQRDTGAPGVGERLNRAVGAGQQDGVEAARTVEGRRGRLFLK